ncbi:MAG: cell division protein FtsQ/DivIB [Pseudooceanicola sp.]
MRKVTQRADPAPSRWSYRMQRILLTPAYRLAVRVGVPFAVSAGAVFLYFSEETRRNEVIDTLAELREDFETRPQFMVNMMAVAGASPGVEEDIREVAQLDFPVSSFDLDLAGMQATISDIPAIAGASLRIRTGGVLEVSVNEREPALIWRAPDGLALVDAEGVVVGGLTARLDRPDLPLIVGRGAETRAAEALDLLDAAGPIADRVRGLVRVGERRWDVVLDRNQRIMLPETDAVPALERVIALHHAQDMLDRDLAAVDMRLAARPTLRMTEEAVEQWWKIKDIVVGASGQ